MLSDVVMLGFPEYVERVIDPEKIPSALAVIVEIAVEPPAIVRFCGVERSSKLGG